MQQDTAGTSFTLAAPNLPGWEQAPATQLKAGDTLKLTKGNIVYEITIPSEEPAQKALQLSLEEIAKRSAAAETKFQLTLPENGETFKGLALLPLSELSRQFAYTVTVGVKDGTASKPIILTSPVATTDGYTPYVTYEGNIYATSIGGGNVFQLTPDVNAAKATIAETIAQKIKSYNRDKPDIKNVTYPPALTKQFQDPKKPDQNIDGEKIARTFGIPYQRDMVFQIFDQLNDEDKAQFFVEKKQKEELTPEQKFEDFKKGFYNYSSSKYTVTLTEGVIGIKPSDQNNAPYFTYNLSIGSNPLKLPDLLSSLSPPKSTFPLYQQAITYSADLGKLQTQFDMTDEGSAVFRTITSSGIFIIKLASMECYKLEADTALNTEDSLKESNKINPSLFGFFELPQTDANTPAHLINIQKLSNFLNIPIINAEHALAICKELPETIQKKIKSNCAFNHDDLSEQAPKHASPQKQKLSLPVLIAQSFTEKSAAEFSTAINSLQQLLKTKRTTTPSEEESLPDGTGNPNYFKKIHSSINDCLELIEILSHAESRAEKLKEYLQSRLATGSFSQDIIDVLGESLQISAPAGLSPNHAFNKPKKKTSETPDIEIHKKPATDTAPIAPPLDISYHIDSDDYFKLMELVRDHTLALFSEKMPLSEDCLKTFDPIVKLFAIHSLESSTIEEPDQHAKDKIIRILLDEDDKNIKLFVQEHYLESAEKIALSKVPEIIAALSIAHISSEKISIIHKTLIQLGLSEDDINKLFKEMLAESDPSDPSGKLSEKISELYALKRENLAHQMILVQKISQLYSVQQEAISKVPDIANSLQQEQDRAKRDAILRKKLSNLRIPSADMNTLLDSVSRNEGKEKLIEGLSNNIKALYQRQQEELLGKAPDSPIDSSSIKEIGRQALLYKEERVSLKKKLDAKNVESEPQTPNDYALKLLFSPNFSSSSSRFFLYNAMRSRDDISKYAKKDFAWDDEFKKYHIYDKREQNALIKVLSQSSTIHLANVSSQIRALFLDYIDGSPVHTAQLSPKDKDFVEQLKQKSATNPETVNAISRKIFSLMYSTSLTTSEEAEKEIIFSHLQHFFPKDTDNQEKISAITDSIYEKRKQLLAGTPDAKVKILKDFIEYQANISNALFPSTTNRSLLEASPPNQRMLALLIAHPDIKIPLEFYTKDNININSLLQNRTLSSEKGSSKKLELSDIISILKKLTKQQEPNQQSTVFLKEIWQEVCRQINTATPPIATQELLKIGKELEDLAALLGHDNVKNIHLDGSDSVKLFAAINMQKELRREHPSNELENLGCLQPKELQSLLVKFILTDLPKDDSITEADRTAILNEFIAKASKDSNTPIQIAEIETALAQKTVPSADEIAALEQKKTDLTQQRATVQALSQSLKVLKENIETQEKLLKRAQDQVASKAIAGKIETLKSKQEETIQKDQSAKATLKKISTEYKELQLNLDGRVLLTNCSEKILSAAKGLLAQPLSQKAHSFLKSNLISSEINFKPEQTTSLSILPATETQKKSAETSSKPKDTPLDIAPSITKPVVDVPPKKSTAQQKNMKTEERHTDIPTSALTERLTLLLKHITESTHPNVLLNDLLHERKKDSI